MKTMRARAFIILLCCCLLNSVDLRGQAQQYTLGIPVLDTIFVLSPFSQDSCFPFEDVDLDAELFTVTGIELYLVIDSINADSGSVRTDHGGVLKVGDTLSVPFPDTVSSTYKFYFADGAGGSVTCRLMAEGVPTVFGEPYVCDSLSVQMTANLCSNTMLLIGTDTCTVNCGPPPIPGFKFKTSASGNGYLVDFIDTSTFATSWNWDFGDGSFDTLQNSSHVYSDSGSFNVCLIVSHACGVATLCANVDVYCEKPQAAFDTLYLGMGVDFIDLSTSATSWFWDFGDGNQSNLQQPFNLYANTGSYNVCLIVGNACSLDTICMAVLITCPLPAAGFYANIPGPDYFTVNFSDQSLNAVTWNWSFGDGGQSTLPNPVYSYPDTNVSITYNVCLYITNACGSDSICDTMAVTIPKSVEEQSRYSRIIRAHPNPFKFSTKLELSDHVKVQYSRLLLYNAIGENIGDFDLNGRDHFVLHAEQLEAGIYFYNVQVRNGASYQGRVVLIP